MTIADYFENKSKQARKKFRAEGQAWNERRIAAESRGEPFDEPFPGSEDTGKDK